MIYKPIARWIWKRELSKSVAIYIAERFIIIDHYNREMDSKKVLMKAKKRGLS